MHLEGRWSVLAGFFVSKAGHFSPRAPAIPHANSLIPICKAYQNGRTGLKTFAEGRVAPQPIARSFLPNASPSRAAIARSFPALGLNLAALAQLQSFTAL